MSWLSEFFNPSPPPQQRMMSAEEFGFDQGVIDKANERRQEALDSALGMREGYLSRARDSFSRQGPALDQATSLMGGLGQFRNPVRNITQQGLDEARGYMSRLKDVASQQGAMIGRDRDFYRGLESQTGQINQDIQSRIGEIDTLRRQASEQPMGLAGSLGARARQNIQRDVAGQQQNLSRTLSARGIDPTSVQAITAMSDVNRRASEAKDRASQDAYFNARNIQSQDIAQQAGLIGQGINAQMGRQNLLNQLRTGRMQETGQDMNALRAMGGTIAQGAGQNLSAMSAGLGAYNQLANMQRAQAQGMFNLGQYAGQFGMQNQQSALGLDQMKMQDAIFDINRMDQRRLAQLGANQQIASNNAQLRAGATTGADRLLQLGQIGAKAYAGGA